MAAASGENLDKLEDMIVRAAETTAAHIRAAKAAIGTVIFGQDKVIDHARSVHLAPEKGDSERLQKWLENLDPDDLGKYKM